MGARPHARILSSAGAFVGVALIVAMAFVAPAVAAEEGGSESSNVSVTIVDDASPSPTPSASSTPSATPSRGPGVGSSSSSGAVVPGGVIGSNGGSGQGGSGTADGTGQGAAAPGETSMAGMLYISGLGVMTAPSVNPFDGTVRLSLAVRNASSSPVDSSVRFWVTTIFGNQLDEQTVTVPTLQPGQLRVVEVDLHNSGQWGVLSAHATYLPPDTVDGVSVAPMTRDAIGFAFPWLVAMALVLVALGVVLRLIFVRWAVVSPEVAAA